LIKPSEILKDKKEIPELMEQWMPNDKKVLEIRLLYRASRDG